MPIEETLRTQGRADYALADRGQALPIEDTIIDHRTKHEAPLAYEASATPPAKERC